MKEVVERIGQYIVENAATIVIWIVGLILVGVVLALVTQWLKSNSQKLQGKKGEQDKKLKEHFAEIKTEAISLVNALNNLTPYKGAILIYPKNNQYNSRIGYSDGMSILPLSTVNFSSHFPKEASIFEGLRRGIEEHNKRHFALEDKSKDKDKYQKEVQYLADSQNIIMVVGKDNLSQEIMSKLDNVERFWPGTRSYRFKKIKSCPRCKEIY